MRIGIGYDVHKLVTGRDLVLGGVKVDYHLGLLGHSDADVLTHAIMDALLGAAAAGDIGKHFPDINPRYQGIASIKLLKQVTVLLAEQGYVIVNVDSVVIAQAPRLAAHISTMRSNLAEAMALEAGAVAVKATTTEGLGFTGTGEGIAAQAVCLISKK